MYCWGLLFVTFLFVSGEWLLCTPIALYIYLIFLVPVYVPGPGQVNMSAVGGNSPVDLRFCLVFLVSVFTSELRQVNTDRDCVCSFNCRC